MYDIRKINIWKTETSRQDNSPYRAKNIEELELSTRAQNSLKRAGCSTVDDVLRILKEDEKGWVRGTFLLTQFFEKYSRIL